MFLIWYLLFAFLYSITLILYFFFCKILKFNDVFFIFIFSNLKKFFILNDLMSNTSNTDISLKNQKLLLNFKTLYTEIFFFKNFFFKDFKNSLIFFNLNRKLYSSVFEYSMKLNLLSFLTFKTNLLNSININKNILKKINLNYFSNIIYIVKTIKPIYYLSSQISSYNNDVFFTSRINNSYKFSSVKIHSFNNYLYNNYITISSTFNNLINSNWIIKFSPSNFIKYITLSNYNTYSILYLRKNKIFNKGRYSRNRQYYRTGVYWCLYVNIIAVIGIYFWFYRFTMNFGYLWWLLFFFISSFVLPKVIKYRLYNPLNLFNSLLKDLLWINYILSSINIFFKSFFNKFKLLGNNFFFNNFFFKHKTFYLYTYLLYNKLNIILNIILNKSISSSIYVWEFNNSNYYYSSIIKSKPVILEKIKHFFNQIMHFIFSK